SLQKFHAFFLLYSLVNSSVCPFMSSSDNHSRFPVNVAQDMRAASSDMLQVKSQIGVFCTISLTIERTACAADSSSGKKHCDSSRVNDSRAVNARTAFFCPRSKKHIP